MYCFRLTLAIILLQCTHPVAVSFILDIPNVVLKGSSEIWKTLVKKYDFSLPLDELAKSWAYDVSENDDMRVNIMTKDSVDDYRNECSADDNKQEPVKFWLYTRKNKRDYEELDIEKLKSKYFLKRKPLMVITHGWISNGEMNSTQLINKALLKKRNANVIVVDWRDIASKCYYEAASSVRFVGEKVCELLIDMSMSKKFKLRRKDVHLVGHSMGAHVMGAAGKYLRKLHYRVSRITGLDPARPFFEFPPVFNGLKKQDALFVDIIHTNAGILGISSSRGHADFYPNGGVGQPGCYSQVALTPIVCDHARAYHFFAESILHDEFEATRCASYILYELGACPYNERNFMGYRCKDNAEGKYYLNTDPPKVDCVF